MKHTIKILFLFLSLFLLSQALGLYLLSQSVTDVLSTPEGIKVIYENTSIGERPDVEGYNVLLYIGLGVLVGTILLLMIAKFNKVKFWKVWFFLAAWMTISISIGVFINESLYWISWIIAAVLAFAKIKYPHPIIHNLTELLMYAGIGILLAPILSVSVAIILLIAISVYDAYAVWKSKHMIKLAEFTKKSSLFPGLAFTYRETKEKTIILSNTSNKELKEELREISTENKKESVEHHHKKSGAKTGVLGGGDVIFPLLFAGAMFAQLLSSGHTPFSALSLSFIISLGAAAALGFLFFYGKKDRYYPAMPYITAGCLLGYLIIILIV